MFWFGSLLADILFLLTILLVSILTYFYYRVLYWQQKQVPYIPPSFPYGSIKEIVYSRESFGQAIANFYRQFREKGCKYGGFYMYTAPQIVITDPELIKSILTRDFKNFHDRAVFVDTEIDPLSGNLFNTTGEKWRRLRKKITPTFTSGKMKIMFNTLFQTAEEMTSVLDDKVKKQEKIDIKDLLSKYTIDVIASCVFGLEIHALQGHNTEFRHYGSVFMKSTLANNFLISFGIAYHKILSFLRVRQVKQEVEHFFTNLLATTIEAREKNNIKRNDFIDMFIKMKNFGTLDDEDKKINDAIPMNENNSLTFIEFAAQAFLFFIAGYETTAQSISFCLYELCLQTDIQDKLREEIQTVLQKTDGKTNYDSVFEMEYLDQIIQETLRKYPSADSFQRRCTESYKVPGSNFVIEKETPIWISVSGLHMDPEYFPDPEKFNPERFTEEEKSKRLPFTYLPFGEGPRNCIGSRFALLQIKTAVIELLKNFKFTLDPTTKTPLEISTQGILLGTKNTIYLRASRIK